MRSLVGSCVLALLGPSIRSRTWRRCSKVVFVCVLARAVLGQPGAEGCGCRRLRPRARHLRRRDAWDPSFWGSFEAGGPGTWGSGSRPGRPCRGGVQLQRRLWLCLFLLALCTLVSSAQTRFTISVDANLLHTICSNNTRAAAIQFAVQRAVKALKTLTRSAHGSRG